MSKVFVTGANGFIGQHIVKQLLEKQYLVVGSVRSKEKGDALLKNFGGNFSYEVVNDIVKPGSFNSCLQKHSDIIGFFHNASPLTTTGEDFEQSIILPAIEGTKNVLMSVYNYCDKLENFIYTSSFATVNSKEHTKETILTEQTWNQIGRHDATNPLQAYIVSKTYAEKAVWEFEKTYHPKFKINTVNPSMVIGPQAFDSSAKGTLNLTAEFINKMLKLNSNDPIPSLVSGFVDVRDVARAHLLAFENGMSNERLLVTKERSTGQLLMDIIHKSFPQLSHLPVGEPGTTKEVLENLAKIDNSRTRELVGPFRPIEESLVDLIKQILENA